MGGFVRSLKGSYRSPHFPVNSSMTCPKSRTNQIKRTKINCASTLNFKTTSESAEKAITRKPQLINCPLSPHLLLCCFVGISALGNSGHFPRGKPVATESHYQTYGACWVFLCFHTPPNSDVDYRIFIVRTDVNAWG